MTTLDIVYEGGHRCRVRHLASGAELLTDAPTDNGGCGLSFSPTDLLAASFGTCLMTVLALRFPEQENLLRRTRVQVIKKMRNEPVRCLACLQVEVALPAEVPGHVRTSIEALAGCTPVGASLADGVAIELRVTTTVAADGNA